MRQGTSLAEVERRLENLTSSIVELHAKVDAIRIQCPVERERISELERRQSGLEKEHKDIVRQAWGAIFAVIGIVGAWILGLIRH